LDIRISEISAHYYNALSAVLLIDVYSTLYVYLTMPHASPKCINRGGGEAFEM
jgi:hypothetical protein